MKYIKQHPNGYEVFIPNLATRYFSFSRFPGANALYIAVAWRDAQLKENDLMYLLGNLYQRPKTSNAVSGPFSPIIGVNYQMQKKTGTFYCGWSARYSFEKKQRNRFFSINKYGQKKAFLMACYLRYQHCGILYVKCRPPFEPGVPYTDV